MRFDRTSKVVRLALLGSLLATAAHGSPPSGKPLKLKLRALSEKACLGSFVTLELILTNEDETDVNVSQLEIWSNYGISSLDADGKKRGVGLLIVPGLKEDYQRMQNDIVTLTPRSSYTTTHKLGLTDAQVFDSAQNYQINSLVIYNHGDNLAASNSVTIQVTDCKAN